MRILVFQHHALEHPGIFRDFMNEDEVEWVAIQLQDGQDIPKLDSFDALWVMGGPMDVWEEDKYPWLINEKAAIHDAVMNRKMPFLGLCLGHQLLGEVAGGKCEKLDPAEVGLSEIGLTREGQMDPLVKDFDDVHKAINWHGVHVAELPPDTVVLASTDVCSCQAMRVGEQAWGIQYHVEVTKDTVPEWSKIPEYSAALESVMGEGAIPDFIKISNASIGDFNRHARLLYNNFMNFCHS